MRVLDLWSLRRLFGVIFARAFFRILVLLVYWGPKCQNSGICTYLLLKGRICAGLCVKGVLCLKVMVCQVPGAV